MFLGRALLGRARLPHQRLWLHQQRRLDDDGYYQSHERHYDDGDGGGDGPAGSWAREWLFARRRQLIGGGVAAGGAATYYWTHLEDAPITHRRRFMQVSHTQEQALAQVSYDEIMKQYGPAILPAHHPVAQYVNRVATKIIGSVDPALVQEGTRWRVYVVDAPVANAFVLPGGEIFVFTGILPIVANEDGLAVVLGHEIAHKVARHVAEKVSFHQFISIASGLVSVLLTGDVHVPYGDIVKNLLVFLPFSRKCEVECSHAL